jgi:hypothetical protein
MAAVSFVISAIDRTRAAFLSVNRNLNAAAATVKSLNGGFIGLGVRMAGLGSLIMLTSRHIRDVASNIREIQGVPDDAVTSFERFNALTKDLRKSARGWTAEILDGIATLPVVAKFHYDRLTKGLAQAYANAAALDKQARDLRKEEPEYKAAKALFDDEAQKLLRIGDTVGQTILRVRQETAAAISAAQDSDASLKQLKDGTDALKELISAEKDFLKLKEAEKKAQTEAGQAYAKTNNLLLPLRDRIEGLQNAYWRLNVELAKFNGENNAEHLEKRTQIFEEQKRIQEQLGKAYDEQNKIAREVGSTLASGFEDAVFAGGKLRDVVRGLAGDLLRLMFRNMITSPLADFFSGGISSLLGVPRNAIGGPVSGGKPTIVGELGPELFVPTGSGRILRNDALGGSGPSYSFTYNIASGVSRSELAPLLRQTERNTIAAIADTQRRGKSFAAALA